jgi:hypothetical protein
VHQTTIASSVKAPPQIGFRIDDSRASPLKQIASTCAQKTVDYRWQGDAVNWQLSGARPDCLIGVGKQSSSDVRKARPAVGFVGSHKTFRAEFAFPQ